MNKLFTQEDNLGTEAMDENIDLLDSVLSIENYEAEQAKAEISDDMHAITVATEAIATIDALITSDKDAIENDGVTAAYVKLSNENFKAALEQIGYDVNTLKISQEDAAALSPADMLALSIEEKEEAKKTIMAKIKEKMSAVGKAIKNFGKLLAVGIKNNLNVVKDLRKKIDGLPKDGKPESLSSSAVNTFTRLTRHFLGFSDINKIGTSDLVKLSKDMSRITYTLEGLKVGDDNLKNLVKNDYDASKVKFNLPPFSTDTEKKAYGVVKSNLETTEDKLVMLYLTNWGNIAIVANYLYSTGKKPGFFTNAVNIGNTTVKIKRYDHKKTEVAVPDVGTLKDMLKVAEDNISSKNEALKYLMNIYETGDAIGDLSVAIYAQHLWTNINDASTFFSKGLLHAINVMASEYKKEK